MVESNPPAQLPEKPILTPRKQLDITVSEAQAAFDNNRLQLAAQEGFIAGLKQARDLWDASTVTHIGPVE